MTADGLPLATLLVLRDQTRADGREVLLAAVHDLIERGVWQSIRRPLRPTRLVRGEAADISGLPEPLPFADAVLRTASRGAESQDVRKVSAWITRRDRSAFTAVLARTVEDCIARGLLVKEPHGASSRIVATAAAQRATAALPPRAGRKRSPHRLTGFAFASGGDVSAAWTTGYDDGITSSVGGGHGGGGDSGGGHHAGGGGHHG